jgi:mRNA-degrading endonuclease HigB of HigAB toxin-antitoxin module
MRIISRRAIREFAERYPLAESALDVWYRAAKQADWSNPAEVREVIRMQTRLGSARSSTFMGIVTGSLPG